MKYLNELLNDIYVGTIPQKFQACAIRSVVTDSRKVIPGSLFVAIKGPKQDGADFVSKAALNGAACIVMNKGQGILPSVPEDLCILQVDDTRAFLARVVQRFFGHPSQDVRCIGVTGTNGKTTTTYLIESIFRAAGKSCGIIGTIGCQYRDKKFSLNNTTPGLIEVTQYLADMRDSGVDHCAMEVSSHALDQGRVDGLAFRAGVFTNLTQDHLDYHKDLEEYFTAKAKLFQLLSPDGVAVVNADDAFGRRLQSMTQAKILRYGLDLSCEVAARDLDLSVEGVAFTLVIQREQCRVQSPLIGRHNVYNILGAAAACRYLGVPMATVKDGIEALTVVPGRLDRVATEKDFSVFVDYAHTDDALMNVLSSLRPLCAGRLIVVFGCGGDRDRTKRPKMGRVASQLADFSVLTNDNPRTEDPLEITKNITAGFIGDQYAIVYDRREAIRQALMMARKGDIVLVAGKGHENYQIFKDKTVAFDDKAVIGELMRC